MDQTKSNQSFITNLVHGANCVLKSLRIKYYAIVGLIIVGAGTLLLVDQQLSPTSAQGEYPPLAPLPAVPEPLDNLNTPEKVDLGRLLFFDPRMSADGSISCNSCHSAVTGYGATTAISFGGPGTSHWRNASTLINVGYYNHLNWDGNRKSIEQQNSGAWGGAVAGNLDKALAEERLAQIPEYVKRFREVFGTDYPKWDDALKAVAAYQRTLVSQNVPFDIFLKGDDSAISNEARRGYDLFRSKAGCIACHNGPLVSDDTLHATGVPQNPDFESQVVNRRGNHSIRGGTLALKCYNPNTPTRERLLYPQIHINGQLTRVDWDTALEVMAAVSKHVLANHGEAAWAMKTFSYEFFENTFAITKLAFGAIGTPAFSQHDKPGMGNDTAGFDDSGLINFNASYEDWEMADVVFISGTDPFESKTVIFTEYMMKGPKLIIAVPRRSAGVAFAEANGGLFLQVLPGSDTLLHLAISRYILENNWQDQEFIDEWVASSWEIDAGMGRGTRNTPWQWRTTWGQFGADFAGYKDWLLNYQWAELDKASEITSVPKDKMVQAAEMITGAGGERPKASFGFEKGNYWSNNYLNTASYAAMGLLCGAGNRLGQRIARLGGHQRGWMEAAGYPRDKSPEKLPGRRKIELDLDRWVEAGRVRFAWVIGTTWTGAMAASQELAQRFRDMTRDNPHQITSSDTQDIIDTLIERVESGGMVVANSEIYPVEPIGTEFADIVLPAAAWGEHDASRCNGERRIRLFSKFYDPPGEAQPDWWIISRFAQKMGYEGFDWEIDNDVFEEAARFSRGGLLDYNALVWKARHEGKKGHDALRELGTAGIQCPIRVENGELVGTKRVHDSTLVLGSPEGPTVHNKWLTHFRSHSGKALLIKTPWELFNDFYERVRPDPAKGEFWITNGRINELWQSGFDDRYKPFIENRWPDTFAEISPQDATTYGVESGDEIRMFSDDILIQTKGFNRIKPEEFNFTWMLENGHIRVGSGEARAVAIVTEAVPPGVIFTNFLHPSSPANSLVHRVPDPITNRYRFKLGKGQIERLGESPYKNDFRFMSFKPRDVA